MPYLFTLGIFRAVSEWSSMEFLTGIPAFPSRPIIYFPFLLCIVGLIVPKGKHVITVGEKISIEDTTMATLVTEMPVVFAFPRYAVGCQRMAIDAIF